MAMTKDEYWEKFSKSGCVADYLDYVNAKEDSNNQSQAYREDISSTYAGFNKCDGDDSKVRTDR